MVVPFNISCGQCFMCDRGLQSQCETTQVREHGTGAALFGYTKLYGQVPGAQAELLRVPHADYGPIKVPEGPPDERYLYLSDVLPTAWQAVEYADVPRAARWRCSGSGRSARWRPHRSAPGRRPGDRHRPRARAPGQAAPHGVDARRDRRRRPRRAVRELTGGRGADAVIDAVGMEAHGSPSASMAQTLAGLLPDAVARTAIEKAGVDRLAALQTAIDLVRRGGTVSIVGVYGGR